MFEIMVLALIGFVVFAVFTNAHIKAIKTAMGHAAQRRGPHAPASSSSDDSTSSSLHSGRPDEGMIAHQVAHHGLNAHGEALVRHHGMDPHTAALHSGSGTGGIGGGGIGGSGNDSGSI